jgi:Zn-dependent peptidase ImmA (M78 family)
MPTQEMIPRLPINPEILAWARSEAKLSAEGAAAKAKIHELKAKGGEEALTSDKRLELWEKGIQTPTFTQLEQLAKAYRRPIITFFLRQPPKKETKLADFRTIKNAKEITESTADFSALLRQIEADQTSLKDILADTRNESLTFVGSARNLDNAVQIAGFIKKGLKFSTDKQKQAPDSNIVFNAIRNNAEELGVFVVVQGNLGSHHTNLKPEVFRGLALSDKIAPFIVINPNDAPAARVFTIIHELCHIWRGETGISNLNGLNIEHQNELQNELLCDAVAGEFLAPGDALLSDLLKIQSSRLITDQNIVDLSKKYNVSRLVIARRLYDLKQIDKEFYWNFFDRCKAEWEELQKIKIDKKQKARVSYKYQIHNKLGERFIKTVLTASQQGKISELDAAHLLNVKINNFSKIV